MKQYIAKSEEKLIDLQKQIQAKDNTLQNTQQNMSRSEEKLIDIGTKIQAKDKTDQETMQNMTKFDDDSKVKLEELQTNINMLQNETMVIESKSIRSCKDISKIHSAKYSIYVRNDTLASVVCEDAAFGGGWIVIQHRFNGQVDFYRTWAEYRDGFGSLDGEFWWGLKYLHWLTSARKYELLVEMKDYNGSYGYARYDRFKVGSEAQNFYLKVGNYSGTAGDSLFYSQNMEFTTKDSDNDKTKRVQCAEYHHGAWWHNYCTFANLNGPYTDTPAAKEAMFWYEFKNDNRPMAYTRMMIREIDP
ncbi:AGAP011225-PA-like protein [Anopheles sinensis]|uniref:AGAP011225-PA-like protein n=1 Tax=Anopheles sinensis TaxID=74873 RepID=A0A084WHL7_ANOSI|nr:AGAP011225-PA-like protein [Anopheles sinensis]